MALHESIVAYFGSDQVFQLKDRPEVFCCYKINGRGQVYQIVYIDLSNAWLDAGLEAYLEDIVSQTYYTSEGYLQWNFYYYFLTDAGVLAENLEIKFVVENDEAFARKSVVTESEFISLIRATESIGQTNGQLDGGDLYSEWINYLRANEL